MAAVTYFGLLGKEQERSFIGAGILPNMVYWVVGTNAILPVSIDTGIHMAYTCH